MSASRTYVELVRLVLEERGAALDEEREGKYLADCEKAEISPRVAAEVVAMTLQAEARHGQA